MGDGVCSLFTRHTTCALTVLTNEAGIAEDFLSVLRGLVPQTSAYVHDSADHVRAHVLSALVGPSVSVPVRDGRLGLGPFQHIVLVEFEGPRPRRRRPRSCTGARARAPAAAPPAPDPTRPAGERAR